MSTFAFLPRSFKKRKTETTPTTTTTTPVQHQAQVSVSVASLSTPAGPPVETLNQGRLSDNARGVIAKENGKGKEKEKEKATSTQVNPQAGPSNPSFNSNPSSSSSSLTKVHDSEDLARLVWLSLSDYALWSDVDLRRKIDWASIARVDDDGGDDDDEGVEEEGAVDPQHQHVRVKYDRDDGYIPLSYLIKNSPVFLQAASSPSPSPSPALAGQPETTYVKAIRTHAAHLVEVRFIVTDEEPPAFGSSAWSKTALSSSSGYEVRRRKRSEKEGTVSVSKRGKGDWDGLTIYVENIPIQFRNICGVSKLISSLLPFPLSLLSLSPQKTNISNVQNVSFPAHHNDRPGDLATCKGFALVTLSSSEDVRYLLDEWPWEHDKVKAKANAKAKDRGDFKEEEEEEVDIKKREAVKFGLRCLSKGRWEELRAEYLLYRQQLVAELEADNEAQEKLHTTAPAPAVAKQSTNDRHAHIREERHDIPPPPPLQAAEITPEKADTNRNTLHANSPFPPECLVFVRNVHPETNKTTLRTLFSQASKSKSRDGHGQAAAAAGDGVDYVDYTKSLDSCYLRFSSPSQASLFVKYFISNPISQTSGLDGDGKPTMTSAGAQPVMAVITPELVTGKREELYWQKVPEKVRRQAVEKALRVVQGLGEAESYNAASTSVNHAIGKKRRRGK